MERISVAEASGRLDALIDHVARDKVTIELARGNEVVAILSPKPQRLTASELAAFFRSLPALEEDSEAFASDVESVRPV
jgi:hypothetical protein